LLTHREGLKGNGMFRHCFLFLAATLPMTLGAEAAHLDNIQGIVLVNRGSGFQPPVQDVELNPGDRVKVVSGTADIVYDRCRTVTVGKGQVIMVVSYAVTNGTCTGGYKDVAAAEPAVSSDLLIVGGLIAGGGVGLGVGLSHNDPASP
jgi:hypothetical protein